MWLNGQRIGSGGAMVEPLTRNCYFPHLIRFQRGLLLSAGNRLDIRVVGYPQDYVASRQRSGGLGTVRIGEQSELVQRARELVQRCDCMAGCPACVGPVLAASEGKQSVTPKSLALEVLGLLASQVTA